MSSERSSKIRSSDVGTANQSIRALLADSQFEIQQFETAIGDIELGLEDVDPYLLEGAVEAKVDDCVQKDDDPFRS